MDDMGAHVAFWILPGVFDLLPARDFKHEHPVPTREEAEEDYG